MLSGGQDTKLSGEPEQGLSPQSDGSKPKLDGTPRKPPLKSGEYEWTNERVEQLKALWADGRSQDYIRVELGLHSRGAVSGKVARLGLPKRDLKKQEHYRSGPVVSYEEKARRALERAERKRQRMADGKLPPLVIIESAAQVEFLGIALLDLERDMCRYPRGEGAAIRFCGQIATHRSYCTHCFALAYQVGSSRPSRPFQNRETHQLVVPNGPEGGLCSP